jgi:hypothetical protein
VAKSKLRTMCSTRPKRVLAARKRALAKGLSPSALRYNERKKGFCFTYVAKKR